MVSYKKSYFTMAYHEIHAWVCNGISLNHTRCNSMNAQLQILWILYT